MKEQFDKFLADKGIRAETPEQAREFVDIIKHSADPRIRMFNYRIFMREIRRLLLRMPRSFD